MKEKYESCDEATRPMLKAHFSFTSHPVMYLFGQFQ